MSVLWQDLRYAARMLAKSPGFTALAAIALALGVSASSAIFSVIDNVLLNPFPYADSQHLVSIEIHDTGTSDNLGRNTFSAPEFLDFAQQNHVFDRVIGGVNGDVLYRNGEGTERFSAALVTPNTFESLAVKPLLGRGLQPSDGKPGAAPVFVLSYKTWMSQFASDPGILNNTFVLNGTPTTLVGIMPKRFAWSAADLWMPHELNRSETGQPDSFWREWYFLGHLSPGISMREAQADLNVLAHQLSSAYPKDYPKNFTVETRTLADSTVGQFRTTLFMVLAAVALLLLIGCGNVANLLLARATTREKEFAIRSAMGASPWRVIRQLLVESLLLAACGAAFGLLLAWGGLKILVAAIPDEVIPAEAVIQMNGHVLLFTLFVAVATAIVFGLAPALHASRHDLNEPLRDSGKGVSGGFRNAGLRNAVVVLEIALSLTLLVGAGLLIRSFAALHDLKLGLQPDHILVIRLPLPEERYKTAAQVTAFFRPLLLRLKSLPGVVDATETSTLPPYGGLPGEVDIAGKTHLEKWTTTFQLISEGYFPVLRIAFLQGRAFTESDVNGARKLAVINQTFARKYFGNDNPIGQRIRIVDLEAFADPVHDPWFEVIGVVADVKNQGLQQAVNPEVWLPYTLTGSRRRGVLIRTAGDPLLMLNTVRREIWATDSNVALTMNGTLESYINSYSYAQPRFGLLLMILFAGVGLVLVTIGVYSVIAYTTARRIHEIGIRVALGAQPLDILRLIVIHGGKLALAGIAVGLAASFGLTRLMASMLFEVKPADPLTFAAVAALLLGVTLAACYIPARRAMRVDPMRALRYE
jgi:predicted permease